MDGGLDVRLEIITETASIVIVDEQQWTRPGAWFAEEGEVKRECQADRMGWIDTGGDGTYVVRVTDGQLSSLEERYAEEAYEGFIDVPSGHVFVGDPSELAIVDIPPIDPLPIVSLAPGRYEIQAFDVVVDLEPTVINGAAVGTSPDILVVADSNCRVTLLELPSLKKLGKPSWEATCLTAVLPGGRILFSYFGGLRELDLKTGKTRRRKLKSGQRSEYTLILSDERWLFHGFNSFHIYDPQKGQERGLLGRHAAGLTSLAQLPAAVASAGADGVVKLWDIESKALLYEWVSHPQGYVALASAGNTLLSIGADGIIKARDSVSGAVMGEVSTGLEDARWLVVDADGRYAVAASSAGQLAACSVADSSLVRRMGPGKKVRYLFAAGPYVLCVGDYDVELREVPALEVVRSQSIIKPRKRNRALEQLPSYVVKLHRL